MNYTLISILVCVIVFISPWIRSAFGFGNALIAMPLLALCLGVKTATPLVAMTGIVIALVMLLREWRELEFKDVTYLIVSTLVGIPLGLFFLSSAPERIVRMILGLILIGFSLYNLVGPKLPKVRTNALAFPMGFLAGILGGAYNTNGPPVVIYGVMRGWGKEKFRATLQGYFLVSSLIIVISHGMAGLWSMDIWRLFALSIPVSIMGVFAGEKVIKDLPQETYQRLINLFLIVVGSLFFF
jgi:uncharacterized membrane protein YfcA